MVSRTIIKEHIEHLLNHESISAQGITDVLNTEITCENIADLETLINLLEMNEESLKQTRRLLQLKQQSYHMRYLPKTVYLHVDFRNFIFSRVYEKAQSLSQVGVEMGYKNRRGLNNTPRDMWVGKIGIPKERLINLAKFAKIKIDTIVKYVIDRKENVQLDDWCKMFFS